MTKISYELAGKTNARFEFSIGGKKYTAEGLLGVYFDDLTEDQWKLLRPLKTRHDTGHFTDPVTNLRFDILADNVFVQIDASRAQAMFRTRDLGKVTTAILKVFERLAGY